MTARKKADRHDWAAIAATYIEHPTISINQAAAQHGAPGNYARTIAARDNWTHQRAEYQAQATIDRRKVQAAAQAERFAQFTEQGATLAQVGLADTTRKLNRLLTRATAANVQRWGQSWAEVGDDSGADDIDPLDLQRLGAGARQWQALGEYAMGGARGTVPDLDDARELLGSAADRKIAAALDRYVAEASDRTNSKATHHDDTADTTAN